MKRNALTTLLLFLLLLPAKAQQEPTDDTRHITRATLYGVGFSSVFDTYLSPQTYKGVEFRVSRESRKMTPWLDGNISRQVLFQANVAYTRNHVKNNITMAALANWNYGLHYNFKLTPNFRLLAGGVADINGGFVYNLRNGNNPAQARAYINLDASGMAIWDVKIKNFPIQLRYQLNIPFMGVMFMPHYAQSYYEIFSLGYSKGVVNFTSLHNQPSLRQMLTADFPIGKMKMRFAYVWDAQQAKVNNIKTHAYSHIFMAGFVKELYLMK